MKKSLIVSICAICAAVILSSVVFSGGSVKTAAATKKTPVTAISADQKVFLDILNNNYVYGADFDDVDDIVNCSVNRFKSRVSDEGYVSETKLCSFVYDMYGIEIVDLSALNPQYAYKPGFVYAIPSFTEYRHTDIIRLSVNEDGTVSAVTDIEVKSLDGDTENLKAKTLFVKNENSKFGYNIVYSEIFSDNADA
ncbi:MAG TPA: hypothetical protein DEW35_04170 [Ruminococcaceae bacterium]|nr:hypothetical protein [Oscillospiraceae bacterium]